MIARLAIIGVGLIGSSLALALKQAASVEHVVGCGRSLESLQKGIELGVIDSYETSISAAVKNADMVVIAVPLGAMPAIFDQIKSVVSAGTIITDVGSAKASVVKVAEMSLGAKISQFVPGHPIAGREKSGVEAGVADLYQDRRVILTPLPSTDPNAVKTVAAMWKKCGAIVEFLDIKHHDKVLAATSHLPHMLAFALVNHLSGLNEHDEIFKYAAGGFRDFTRIASGDPEMWRDVCLSNGPAILGLIDDFKQELDTLSAAIREENSALLFEMFSNAKAERDSLVGNC